MTSTPTSRGEEHAGATSLIIARPHGGSKLCRVLEEWRDWQRPQVGILAAHSRKRPGLIEHVMLVEE